MQSGQFAEVKLDAEFLINSHSESHLRQWIQIFDILSVSFIRDYEVFFIKYITENILYILMYFTLVMLKIPH